MFDEGGRGRTTEMAETKEREVKRNIIKTNGYIKYVRVVITPLVKPPFTNRLTLRKRGNSRKKGQDETCLKKRAVCCAISPEKEVADVTKTNAGGTPRVLYKVKVLPASRHISGSRTAQVRW